MNFRPLHDRVMVRRIEGDMKSAGGIIIPDTVQEKPMEGDVIAVGPGVRGDDGELHPASWDEALSRAAAGFVKARDEHGRHSVYAIASGRGLESAYSINRWARRSDISARSTRADFWFHRLWSSSGSLSRS